MVLLLAGSRQRAADDPDEAARVTERQLAHRREPAVVEGAVERGVLAVIRVVVVPITCPPAPSQADVSTTVIGDSSLPIP